MKGWTLSRRAWARVFMVSALVALAGCTQSCLGALLFKECRIDGMRLRQATRTLEMGSDRYRDTYLSARAVKVGAEFFVQPDWSLNKPYRVEATFGFRELEDAKRSPNTLVGYEGDFAGSDPLDFNGLFARYVDEGTQVFAVRVTGGVQQNLGQVFFPGVTEVDYAVEDDGSKLRYHARAAWSGGPYQLVAEEDSPDDDRELCPSLGAFNVERGVELVLDNYLLWNSEPMSFRNVHHELEFHGWMAGVPLLDASYGADAVPRDFSRASSSLAEARSEHEAWQVRVGLQLSFKGPSAKQVDKAIGKSLRFIDSAIQQSGDERLASSEKRRKKLLRTIGKAVKSDLKALATLKRLEQQAGR